MRNRLFTFVTMVALLVGVSGACVAIPSLGGPTGVVTAPAAAVAPLGELQLAVSYQSLQANALDVYTAGEDFTVWGVQALVGASDTAELWAAYSTIDDTDVDADIWSVGGKALLAQEPQSQASLAVGGGYFSLSNSADVTLYNAYLVATKDFTPMGAEDWEWSGGAGTRILGSVGLMYINVDPDIGSGESLTKPFVALQFVDAGGTTLGLEYRWDDQDLDDDAVFSAVLTYPFSPEWTVEVGTTNAGPGGFGLDDQDWFARLGYCVPMG